MKNKITHHPLSIPCKNTDWQTEPFGPINGKLVGEFKLYNEDGTLRWDVNIWKVPGKYEIWEKKPGLFSNPLIGGKGDTAISLVIRSFIMKEDELIKNL